MRIAIGQVFAGLGGGNDFGGVVLCTNKSCFVTILKIMLPLLAKSFQTVCNVELQKQQHKKKGGGKKKIPTPTLWSLLFPLQGSSLECLRCNRKVFLMWKLNRLFIDINSTLEMLAMMQSTRTVEWET